MRSTTRSSLLCAEPRLAMMSWRPVRISRAEAAAVEAMPSRLTDAPPPCHAKRHRVGAIAARCRPSGSVLHVERDVPGADVALHVPARIHREVVGAAKAIEAADSRLAVPEDLLCVVPDLGRDPGLVDLDELRGLRLV